MRFTLGTKKNMEQIFTEDGTVVPVTVISVPKAVVTQVKTQEKDGYNAIQVAAGEKKQKNINKAQRGAFKDLGNFRFVREFRVGSEELSNYKVGDNIDLNIFKTGDKVRISGVSKGKGFQGAVKRHGFSGGPRTHGQKHSEREVGAIGGGGGRAGGRVAKGIRMAGRMGGDRVTLKGVKVAHIDSEVGLLYVKGAIPGRRGTLLEISAS